MKFQAKIFFSQVGLQNYSVKFLLTGQCNPMTLLPLLVTPENSLPIPVLVWSLYWSWKVRPAYITWQSSSFSLGVSFTSSLHTKPFPDWLCDKKHFSLFLGARFSTVLTKNIHKVILSYKLNLHRWVPGIMFFLILPGTCLKEPHCPSFKIFITKSFLFNSSGISARVLLWSMLYIHLFSEKYISKLYNSGYIKLYELKHQPQSFNLYEILIASIIFIGLNLVNFYIYYSLFAISKYFEVSHYIK